MKVGTGARVRLMASGQWVGLYRVAGTYKSKAFTTEAEATKWALTQARRVGIAGRMGQVAGAGDRGRAVPTADLVADFLTTLDRRGRSMAHLVDTRRGLESLAAAVPDLGRPGVGVAIEDWLSGLRREDGRHGRLSPATMNKRLTMVRALCRWAVRRDLLAKDPTAAIDRASVPEYLKGQFTVEELRRCLRTSHYKTPRANADGERDKRDPWHLLFAVLTYTGMRFQEAAHLRWEDIDWSGRMLTVSLDAGGKVKRQRERLVPLQDELADLLKPVRRKAGHIFGAQAQNPTRGFRAFLGRAGVPVAGRSPHSLRHGYAGLMTATGVPAQLLMAYMGHSSAATMLIYTKLATKYVAVTQGWGRGEFRLMGN